MFVQQNLSHYESPSCELVPHPIELKNMGEIMKKINLSVQLTLIAASFLFLFTPQYAYCDGDESLKSLVSESGHSKKNYTPEEKAAREQERKEAKAAKAYKRVKNKSWDQLSSREKKYAKKNGIPDEATYDAWKAQQAEIAATKKAAKDAARAEAKKAKQAKENAKAYKRVKNKEWNELTSRELKYAKQHGIDSKEKYDAWKAEQASLATPLQKSDSTIPGSNGLVPDKARGTASTGTSK